MALGKHQYVRRYSEQVVTERLVGDWAIHFLYARAREHAPTLFRALTSARFSKLIAYLNFDAPLVGGIGRYTGLLTSFQIDLGECVDPPAELDTLRKVFERRIRYWDCRPMPEDARAAVAPADARVLIGSLQSDPPVYIKGKFFDLDQLLGHTKTEWLRAFRDGSCAIFRLTPDQYHYNHTPVAGMVVDFYEIRGDYHACNPGAVVQVVTPYSKNTRVVTVIETDVPGGSHVGLVAMIEVVALMIGDVVQCYSAERYDDPQPIMRGMFVQRGQPKSRYRPGSSTDVLLFQRHRVNFSEDLLRNTVRADVHSRFSLGFGTPLVETDVKVRSLIAVGKGQEGG